MKISQIFALARQRRALAKLDDTALQDIGLTRAEAQAEANKPLWDAPAHWQQRKHDNCAHVKPQIT